MYAANQIEVQNKITYGPKPTKIKSLPDAGFDKPD